ncbi:peptidase [Lysinibacillus sp. 2017]|uniref:site-2 protease family protein n=1 Tax=unclassified Lysinibacillus TaxID=2636778 RepID=UPI000D528EE2|nr:MULTISPECIES: M50 family metallopeptidase [unclassified Lysinibacillus]AWE08172.1 peptidase [Lysinibacillus sp. 2017]TGN36467.1 peptidase [Lysinibacillus sp. S2017]
MKLSIHPLFMLLLFLIVLYGNIALYSVLIISLLVHELGHLLAAKLVGAKIQRCIIMPYGGEITLKNELQLSYNQMTLIALGGPIATCFGIVMAGMLPENLSTSFIEIQLLLLAVNLVPIWPLDGAKILCFLLLNHYKKIIVYERYLTISFYLLTAIIIVLLYLLPRSLSLVVISLFLWSKVIGEWRNRKYRSAFEKLVMNRLT